MIVGWNEVLIDLLVNSLVSDVSECAMCVGLGGMWALFCFGCGLN